MRVTISGGERKPEVFDAAELLDGLLSIRAGLRLLVTGGTEAFRQQRVRIDRYDGWGWGREPGVSQSLDYLGALLLYNRGTAFDELLREYLRDDTSDKRTSSRFEERLLRPVPYHAAVVSGFRFQSLVAGSLEADISEALQGIAGNMRRAVEAIRAALEGEAGAVELNIGRTFSAAPIAAPDMHRQHSVDADAQFAAGLVLRGSVKVAGVTRRLNGNLASPEP